MRTPSLFLTLLLLLTQHHRLSCQDQLPLPPLGAPPALLAAFDTYKMDMAQKDLSSTGAIYATQKLQKIIVSAQSTALQKGEQGLVIALGRWHQRLSSTSAQRISLRDGTLSFNENSPRHVKEGWTAGAGRILHTDQVIAPPYRVTIRAKTSNNNLRFMFAGHQIIFNWEVDQATLVADNVLGAPIRLLGMGDIAPNEWHTVVFESTFHPNLPHGLSIHVNGICRAASLTPFAGFTTNMQIYTDNVSMVTVADMIVESITKE